MLNIKINMLDVGDGDAIIVHLWRDSDENCVILIDGGHAEDAGRCITALRDVLTVAKKDGPDLIICTHYDGDHIGGLKKIAAEFGNAIKMVWLHEPHLIMEASELAGKIMEGAPPKRQRDQVLTEALTMIGKRPFDDAAEITLESYDQMKNLVEFLNKAGVPTFEPFAGHYLENWPEVTVIGPTEAFYKSKLAKIKGPKALLLAEANQLHLEMNNPLVETRFKALFEKVTDPCGFLGSEPKAHVTEVNQVSIILLITAQAKRYLFTGDANLDSFKNIPGYPESLQKIHWLKVPHHGSHNNSSPELFEIMMPDFADVSGGDRYLDEEVPNCLEAKGAKVRSTLESGDLIFPY